MIDNTSSIVASVIIPAHNAAGTISRQLNALACQDNPPPFEVLVVANVCTDTTFDVAQSFSDRLTLRVLRADDFASAAYARNVGARNARGMYLLFCDADDEVQCEWVSGMIEPLATGTVDFVGGKVLLDRSELPKWVYYWRYTRHDLDPILVDALLPYAITASLGVTTRAFFEAGCFNEHLPGAAGEDDLLQRCLYRAGFRVGIAPRACVVYSPRTTFSAALAQARAYHRASRAVAELDGQAWNPTTLIAVLKRTINATISTARQKKYFHPFLFCSLLLQNLCKWRDDTRSPQHTNPISRSRPHWDACVRLDAPLLGGLAFDVTTESQGRRFSSAHGVEVGTLRVIENLLPLSGTFVDVGANVGTLTVAAAMRAGSKGRVVAYEPGSEAFHCLQSNIERHRVSNVVEAKPTAVGSERGRVEFNTYSHSVFSGFSKALERYRSGDLIRTEPVDVVTLDDEVLETVDVLKIDVEGFEEEVLRGATDLIASSPHIAVIIEVNFPILMNRGRSPEFLDQYFPRPEWHLFRIDDDKIGAPLRQVSDPATWMQTFADEHYFNILAIRSTQLGRLQHLIS